MKSFIAITREIDDVEAAVSEILSQLDLNGKNKLLKNTVGIISCYTEFIDSGVWSELCKKLPFEIIGATTITNMAMGEIGNTMLCLMVLTDDDVNFSVGLSEPIATEDEAPLRNLYAQTAAKLPDKDPSVIINYAPLSININSDFFVDSMTKISGGVPNFGILTVDHNADYHDSKVMLNGESWADRYAILLIQGLNPEFFVGSINNKTIFTEKSIVTAASGNHLQMVNNMPAKEYLKTLGLASNVDGSISGINSLPLIMDYNDGTKPVIRAMFAFTPDGSVVCGGTIPVGATLSIGSLDAKEITETSLQTLNAAIESCKNKILIIYSCIGRYFSLGYNANAEFETLLKALNNSNVNYLAAYSGGEMCPVLGTDGKYINRNHNNTFVICAL